jgi:hypothetical protein
MILILEIKKWWIFKGRSILKIFFKSKANFIFEKKHLFVD